MLFLRKTTTLSAIQLRRIPITMQLRKILTMPLRRIPTNMSTMPLRKNLHTCGCCDKNTKIMLNASSFQTVILRTLSRNFLSFDTCEDKRIDVYRKTYCDNLSGIKKHNGTNMLAILHSKRSLQLPAIRWHSTRSDAPAQNTPLNATTPKIILDHSVKNSITSDIDPYLKLMRLDKPIGIYLLFWPCAWSLTLGAAAAGSAPSSIAHMFILFGAGSVVMRAAGTTLNDILDQDIDKQVERTKSRPLVTGTVTRRQAIAFLAAELSVGLAILLQLNWYSVMIGASSMLLVTTYPLAKRFTNYPQIVLGATFNYGAVIGYCAMANQLDSMLIPLYLGGVVWTTLYDTIYALQDKADDARIGVKSTALTFAGHTKPALYTCASLMGALWTAAGALASLEGPYYVGVAAATAHACRQIYTLKMDDPEDCAKKFRSNTWIGLIMFLGIIGGTYRQYLDNRRKGKDGN